MVLMNDFKKEYRALSKEVSRVMTKTLESGWYILGDRVRDFEKDFAKYIGVKYSIGVANGMEALQICLMAVGVGPGYEVITVSNSAVATALAISNTGAKPVFVDIDEYYHIDPEELKRKITPNTKAIIPVHLFGQVASIKEILKIARKHDLKVIEDACQAHGASFEGRRAGSFGDLGAFSFYPTKNLGGYGDGGAITTNSKKLYELCLKFRNYGQENRYEHLVKGLNSRLDEVQAAVLSVKLKKLDEFNKKRQEVAKLYFKNLKSIGQIKLPRIRKNTKHAFHLFVIEAEKRDDLKKFLEKNGVQSLVHYPIPIHKQGCYQDDYKNLKLEKTEEASNKILSLPIHPFMSEEEVLKVCELIKKFYKPTVSVGIPAYNEEKNIATLLQLILTQKQNSYKLDKVFVVSDGSDDLTDQRVRNFSKKHENVKLFRDNLRLGKSIRLNQIYQLNKSDILVTFDADVVLGDRLVIEELVRSFKGNIGLVGGNYLPVEPKTFVGKVVASYENFWSGTFMRVNNGDNVHSLTGCIMAMKRDVAKKLKIPTNIIADDHFIYFKVKKLGFDYKFVENSKVFYKVPDNLSDYMLQSTRFITSADLVRRHFGEWVDSYYRIPISAKIFSYIVTFFKEPVYLPLALLLQIYQRVMGFKFMESRGIGTWQIVRSSK